MADREPQWRIDQYRKNLLWQYAEFTQMNLEPNVDTVTYLFNQPQREIDELERMWRRS